jgi:hypothetical protein
MVVIGIDPAIRKNGFALCFYDTINKTIDFEIMDFIDFILFSEDAMEATDNFAFCVENSNLQNLSFDMKGNKGVLARKSRNVGMNQAVSQLTCDLLKRRGFEVVEISPKQKGAKLEHETFKALTMNMTVSNYKGLKGEQDKRDAFKIALLYEKYK